VRHVAIWYVSAMSSAELSPMMLLQKASESLQKRDFVGADRLLGDLLDRNPGDANALHLLGVVRVQQQRPQEALPFLQRSIDANPRHALTHLNLGKVLVLLGSDAEAIEASRALAKNEGIFCGISSGGTFAAARKVAEEAPAGSVILAMLPDTGERYLSTALAEGINEGSDSET
jgi:tetratricopeptide (TPR) repeat protein